MIQIFIFYKCIVFICLWRYSSIVWYFKFLFYAFSLIFFLLSWQGLTMKIFLVWTSLHGLDCSQICNNSTSSSEIAGAHHHDKQIKNYYFFVCMYAWTCNGRHLKVRQFSDLILPFHYRFWKWHTTHQAWVISTFYPPSHVHQISRKTSTTVSLKAKVIIYLFIYIYLLSVFLCLYNLYIVVSPMWLWGELSITD